MQNFGRNIGVETPAVREDRAVSVDVRPLLRLTYLWMGLGLLVTAVIAWGVASSEQLISAASGLFLPVIIGQFILVFALGWGLRRMSAGLATVLFFVYSASVGFTLSLIIYALVESGQGLAIANAFVTTAGLFGTMTVVGFTTSVDLSKYRSYFMMALIGLVIAIVVNMFLGSSGLDLIISVVGVLLFTALTAYDTQKIKELAYDPELQEHSPTLVKLSIMGALTLYLDFINLFIFLLRLFAGGRD